MRVLKSRLKFLQTLRGRLSLWYFGSTLFVFLVFSITLSSILWITLHSQINHHLLTVINEARQIVENNQGVEREGLLRNLVSTQGMTVVLLSPDGAPLLQTNSPDLATISEHQIQQVISSGKVAITEPAFFTAGGVRFSTVPVMESGGRGTLAVGYSIRIIEHTFVKIVAITALAVIILLLPLNYVGYKLLNNYLSPLETIVNASGRVANTKSLSLRVPSKNMTNELKVIAKAFNQMLSKLQKVFQKEHQFFSDTAHALKTPLTVLRSQVEDLPGSNVNEKKTLFKSIDDLAEVIGDLLLISRIETKGDIKKDTFSLTNVMNEFVELTKTLGSEKQLSVKANIKSNISVRADKRLLRRAVINVIQNAVVYSKNKGEIYLELVKNSKTRKIEIIVKDTGLGIAKADLSSVFDRFYRGKTKADTKGSGLGLAITKAVVEGMGGRVLARPRSGKGTEVKIILLS